MKEGKVPHKLSTLTTLMLIMTVVVVTASALFTVLLVQYRTEDLIERADSRLLTAAELTREMIGPGYHDRIDDETSVSEEQFRHLVARNDDLCRRLNLQYLWSVLLVKDRLVFTSATHSDLSNPDSPCASFFEAHRDPESFAPAMQPESKPTFSSFKNEWGEGRQILIPRQDARGRTYIFGASVQLTELNAVIRRTIVSSIGIGLGVFCGAFLLALVLARSFTLPIAGLSEVAGRMATGDLDVPPASGGTAELRSLSNSLDQMRQGLIQHLGALRESEGNLRALFDAISESVFLFDPNGRVLTCNKTFAERLGKHPEDLTDECIYDHLPPEVRARRRDWVEMVVRSGESMCFEDERDKRWLFHCISPIRGITGSVTRLAAFAVDLTKQKEAEKALRESESKYRELSRQFIAVLEAIPDSLSLLTSNHETVWANSSAIESMVEKDDYSPGEPCHKLWHGRPAPCETCSIPTVASTGEPTNRYFSSKDAQTWEMRLIPIKDDMGMVTHIIRLGRDVTLNQRLEAQLRQAQKMEAIGTLAGGIAHDFNNILSPIIGYTELAMEDVSESSPSRYDLKQVLAAAHRAKDLVMQILAFSRLGEEGLMMRPVNINLIVREALKLLRASLPSSIEIRQDLRKVMVLADATQMHQVIVNLCTNAAHAMEDRGILHVSLSEVSLSADDIDAFSWVDLMPGSYLQLTVSDTGKGMSADTIPRIFEPYFTTKEVGKGTGLGLAVVHGIVKRHGGEIRVRSELGKGSVFDVLIPVAEKELEPEIDPSQRLPKGTERILLIDDEPAIVGLGAKMLGQLGYRVTAKTSSRDALDLFRSNPEGFDLIITDYTMPHMAGTDLARESMKIRQDIPIILCTGFSERVTEEMVKEIGVKGFAIKPLDRRRLAELIRDILDAQEQ